MLFTISVYDNFTIFIGAKVHCYIANLVIYTSIKSLLRAEVHLQSDVLTCCPEEKNEVSL